MKSKIESQGRPKTVQSPQPDSPTLWILLHGEGRKKKKRRRRRKQQGRRGGVLRRIPRAIRYSTRCLPRRRLSFRLASLDRPYGHGKVIIVLLFLETREKIPRVKNKESEKIPVDSETTLKAPTLTLTLSAFGWCADLLPPQPETPTRSFLVICMQSCKHPGNKGRSDIHHKYRPRLTLYTVD